MSTELMVVLVLVVLALPFVLMLAFNGRERADSRGDRTSTDWYVRHQ